MLPLLLVGSAITVLGMLYIAKVQSSNTKSFIRLRAQTDFLMLLSQIRTTLEARVGAPPGVPTANNYYDSCYVALNNAPCYGVPPFGPPACPGAAQPIQGLALIGNFLQNNDLIIYGSWGGGAADIMFRGIQVPAMPTPLQPWATFGSLKIEQIRLEMNLNGGPIPPIPGSTQPTVGNTPVYRPGNIYVTVSYPDPEAALVFGLRRQYLTTDIAPTGNLANIGVVRLTANLTELTTGSQVNPPFANIARKRSFGIDGIPLLLRIGGRPNASAIDITQIPGEPPYAIQSCTAIGYSFYNGAVAAGAQRNSTMPIPVCNQGWSTLNAQQRAGPGPRDERDPQIPIPGPATNKNNGQILVPNPNVGPGINPWRCVRGACVKGYCQSGGFDASLPYNPPGQYPGAQCTPGPC